MEHSFQVPDLHVAVLATAKLRLISFFINVYIKIISFLKMFIHMLFTDRFWFIYLNSRFWFVASGPHCAVRPLFLQQW